jgi:hypothetical protein
MTSITLEDLLRQKRMRFTIPITDSAHASNSLDRHGTQKLGSLIFLDFTFFVCLVVPSFIPNISEKMEDPIIKPIPSKSKIQSNPVKRYPMTSMVKALSILWLLLDRLLLAPAERSTIERRGLVNRA